MATSTPTTTLPPTLASVTPSASCTTAVPGRYGNVPVDACNALYNFDPSFPAAVAAAVLFGLLTLAHAALAFLVYRKRYAWVLVTAALWEAVAAACGAAGARDQQNVGWATAHQVLFLLAPLWVNAFVYMTFARMVWFFLPPGGARVGPFRATSLSAWFVWADVLTFLVQATGAVITAPGASSDTIKTGLNIYMAGIGSQEFFIVVFLGLMADFHRKALQLDQFSEISETKKRSWKGLLYALYAVLAFISLRIFYRLAEFGGGVSQSNPIPFHEAYSYALDAFPMMICLLILSIMHPGRTLVGPDSELPKKSRAEKKAEKAKKKAEKASKKKAKAVAKHPSASLSASDVELVYASPGKYIT